MRLPWNWVRPLLSSVLLVTGLHPALARAAEPPLPDRTPPAEVAVQAPAGASYSSPPGCSATSAYYSATPNQTIPDQGVITSTITVSGADPYLWSVALQTYLKHDYSEDLDIYLISPAGTRVTLTTDNGSSNEDVFDGTTWIDSAGLVNPPGPVTMNTFADGVTETPLGSEQPLSSFRGEDPNGVWKLEVRDDDHLIAGTLNSWQLQLTTLDQTPVVYERSDSRGGSEAIDDGGSSTPVDLDVSFEMPVALGSLKLTTYIAHPSSDDLGIDIQLPTGDFLTVAIQQGGPLADVFNGTLWSDAATDPVTDYTGFISGTAALDLAPQESFDLANYGLDSTDLELQVNVTDLNNNGLAGLLDYVELTATGYSCQPNVTVEVKRTADPARLNAPVLAAIWVGNIGADVTGPVYVTVTLPSTAAFLDTAGAWACSGVTPGTLGGTLLCSRPTFAVGLSLLEVVFSPPAGPLNLGNLIATANTAGNAFPAGVTAQHDVPVGLHSANGNPWDVHDHQVYPASSDDGGVDDGGQDALDGWGQLQLLVFDAGGALLNAPSDLQGFGLRVPTGRRWVTTTPVAVDTISVTRQLDAPAATDWLRYVDTFTNVGSASRTVYVGWGGYLGSGSDTGTRHTSSGDTTLTAADTWAVTSDSASQAAAAPLGYALRSPADTTYQGPGIYGNDPFTATWPSSGDANLLHVYRLQLAPGASVSLAYFLYRGVSESTPGPEDCDWYGDCRPAPAAGREVTQAAAVTAALVAHPAFCDLDDAARARIVNWPGAVLACQTYLPAALK